MEVMLFIIFVSAIAGLIANEITELTFRWIRAKMKDR